MLRECRLILPVTDNAGISTALIHKDLQRTLAKRFGGYTMQPVSGGWVNANGQLMTDTSVAYDVAIDMAKVSNGFSLFTALAKFAGKRAGQQSVYVRDGFGQVVIHDLPQEV